MGRTTYLMPSPSSLIPKLKFPDSMSVPDPMPVQTETAATKALARILHGPQKAWNSNVLFLDYRNSATFKDLWLNGLESATPTINAQQFRSEERRVGKEGRSRWSP